MDIKGGGVFALAGMQNFIRHEPVLFLESNTPDEDIAIGQAFSIVPYDVYRVGDSKEVKYLVRDNRDEFGICGTVVGLPKSKPHLFGEWNSFVFQRKRIGQR